MECPMYGKFDGYCADLQEVVNKDSSKVGEERRTMDLKVHRSKETRKGFKQRPFLKAIYSLRVLRSTCTTLGFWSAVK
jgi:hypothetical protein